MSDALSNVGSFLGSGAGKGLLTAGTAGVGLLQNLMAERQANAKQKFVQDLITNPEKFNALVARTEQPLSQGLTSSIGRQVDAYGAERGLGSSPYIMKDVMAQALAPTQQQEQQMAINSLISRLQAYAGQPTMPGVNVTPMLQALSMWKPGAGTGPLADMTVPNVPSPGINPSDYPAFFTPQVDINTGAGITSPTPFFGDSGQG